MILVASFESVKSENESVIKPNLIQVKNEVQNIELVSTIRKLNLSTSELVQKTVIRLKTCRTLLQNVLTQDPKKNSDKEFVTKCQRWKEELSVPDSEISLETVEKCETVLMEKFGELDEVDLKILEINCKHSLSSAHNYITEQFGFKNMYLTSSCQ